MPNVHTTSLVTRMLQTVTRIMSPRYKDVASATFTPLDRNVLDCHVYTIPRDQDVAVQSRVHKNPACGQFWRVYWKGLQLNFWRSKIPLFAAEGGAG
jgi:hypothetical protein